MAPFLTWIYILRGARRNRWLVLQRLKPKAPFPLFAPVRIFPTIAAGFSRRPSWTEPEGGNPVSEGGNRPGRTRREPPRTFRRFFPKSPKISSMRAPPTPARRHLPSSIFYRPSSRPTPLHILKHLCNQTPTMASNYLLYIFSYDLSIAKNRATENRKPIRTAPPGMNCLIHPRSRLADRQPAVGHFCRKGIPSARCSRIRSSAPDLMRVHDGDRGSFVDYLWPVDLISGRIIAHRADRTWMPCLCRVVVAFWLMTSRTNNPNKGINVRIPCTTPTTGRLTFVASRSTNPVDRIANPMTPIGNKIWGSGSKTNRL